MLLGGEHHVIVVVEPMSDQGFNQSRRMLSVAVDEQHRTQARIVEAREQRRLLAEVARQRDELHVRAGGRQLRRDGAGRVGAAVIDVDDLAFEATFLPQRPTAVGEPRVERGKSRRLVEQRDHYRQPGDRPIGRRQRRGYSLRIRRNHHTTFRSY